MNFKIILTIIGIILSLAVSVRSDGDFCAQVIVCDQYGKYYPTPCAFAKAKESNPDLVDTQCP